MGSFHNTITLYLRMVSLYLAMCLIRCTTLVGTLFKIDGLMALFTNVLMTKLIRKYFLFFAAILALTDKRLEIFKRFEPGTMAAWCIHFVLLLC